MNLNEGIYDDLISNIEKELEKLKDIKTYIENYDDKDRELSTFDLVHPETEYDLELDDDDDFTEVDVKYIGDEEDDDDIEFIEEPTQPDEIDKELGDDIVDPDEYDPEEIPDLEIEDDPFEPSPGEKIANSTLKAHEDKEPWAPSLDEEEIEHPQDEIMDDYVFHIKINPDEEDEIIAKIYKDDDDDNWTCRVVKGDEEPLQSMEFDHRLSNIEVIGHLADIYDEIEIIDPREYEYLLDDKEEVDKEYYEDVI